ncbi:hypothetical protein IWW50_002165 [Coemansia erecta]|nr:hypothetical protein GGF43_001746 [Coemansia sp. RSA 2618]KAJ2826855.1 hypothetical protein IWW50_002165 [Coemansia erecta]
MNTTINSQRAAEAAAAPVPSSSSSPSQPIPPPSPLETHLDARSYTDVAMGRPPSPGVTETRAAIDETRRNLVASTAARKRKAAAPSPGQPKRAAGTDALSSAPRRVIAPVTSSAQRRQQAPAAVRQNKPAANAGANQRQMHPAAIADREQYAALREPTLSLVFPRNVGPKFITEVVRPQLLSLLGLSRHVAGGSPQDPVATFAYDRPNKTISFVLDVPN